MNDNFVYIPYELVEKYFYIPKSGEITELFSKEEDLNIHYEWHVLQNKRDINGRITYEKFAFRDPKFNPYGVLDADKVNLSNLRALYKEEAETLANYKGVEAPTSGADVVGFRTDAYNRDDDYVIVKKIPTYKISYTNSTTGRDIILSDMLAVVVFKMNKETGAKDVRTYYLAYESKLNELLKNWVEDYTTEKEVVIEPEKPEEKVVNVKYIDVIDNHNGVKKSKQMKMSDAKKAYNNQWNYINLTKYTYEDVGEIIYEIDGGISFPPKNTTKKKQFEKISSELNVDLTGEVTKRVRDIANSLKIEVSDDFIDSFIKCERIERLKMLDDDTVEVHLTLIKMELDEMGKDTNSAFDYVALKPLTEAHTISSALKVLK